MADDGAPSASSTLGSSTSDHDINISTPAVVTWGATSSVADVTFDARHIPSAREAFFKLRASVQLKANTPTKTHLFFFVHPEYIHSIELDRVGPPPETVRRKLGRDTACLRFTLKKSADLIGPKNFDLTPKNKTSGEMLDSLRCLARQETFSVHFSHKLLSQARLLSLCAAGSGASCKSIARQADLTSLYRGTGGRIVSHLSPPEDIVEAPAVPSSPPSYDELGPSPPLAPLDAATGETSCGGFPLDALFPQTDKCASDFASKKRRRTSSSDDVASSSVHGVLDVEQICRKIFEMQKAEMLRAMEAQQDKLYDRLLADIKPYISQRLVDLETRLLEHVDERLGKEAEEYTEHLEQRLEEVVDEVNDAMRSRVSDVDDKVEDEFYGLRDRLEGFVRDEVADAEERIVEHLESSASISLTFSQ